MIIDCTEHLFGWKPASPDVDCSPLVWGAVGAGLIAVVLYLAQVLGMQDWSAPFGFIRDQWYLLLPLVIGFGVQMGLFRAIRLKAKQGSAALIASGGVSTSAMAACCMHNFAALLPVVGLSGAASFLSKYQTQVFMVSILFVVVGTVYMWKKYRTVHACCDTVKE